MELLYKKVFRDDVAELTQSHIAEVRLAAAVVLADQQVLGRFATQDQDPLVREEAVKYINDDVPRLWVLSCKNP